MDRAWQRVADDVAAALHPAGLDLVHPFRLAWYERAVPESEHLAWAHGGEALALLVGNTRALWPHLVEHLGKQDGEWGADPLDRWVEARIGRVVDGISGATETLFAHEEPPRRRAFARLAVHAGFAALASSQLLAHPRYGPWFALRAVIVIDVPGPDGPPPRAEAPCAGCSAPCEKAFAQASAVADPTLAPREFREGWRAWLAVRDACPIGREYRYDDEQILYHYARRWPQGRGAPGAP